VRHGPLRSSGLRLWCVEGNEIKGKTESSLQ
jgi:hypothetical protein